MSHVAIDLGGRNSQICVRANDGRIVLEARCETRRLGGWLKRQEPGVVVLETCAEAFAVADQARAAGHDVRLVPSTLAPSLGVGLRGVKTDRRDAQMLSEASCRMELGSVHVPSQRSRDIKETLTQRDVLVRSRTALINDVRGVLRTRLLRVRGTASGSFVTRAREVLAQHALGLSTAMSGVLDSIAHLTAHIATVDKELREAAKQDEVCRRLMSVPGVGPITALRFKATVDEVTRFQSAHALESYLGLTPGERSSSLMKRRTGITHAGSPKMRWLLVQAAWSAQRTRPEDPMVRWAQQVRERRGRFVATVALARKMAGILYAMWRDGTSYDPRHVRPTAS